MDAQARELPEGYAAGTRTEEVRVAMAWNGGVSLAIWMGGVAVELDAARRKVGLYADICEAFNRELKVDILCGASAGGLNGALLAGAIQKPGGKLEPDFLRERWIQVGDLEALLQPVDNNQPAALMQGEVFYERLKGVFRDLLGDEQTAVPANGPADVLLDVQVTDVQGAQRSYMDDWDELFYAREYRAPVRFRQAGDYTAGTLAAAARASASFPGAFEAQQLNRTAADLAGFPNQERWAIDGGVLENAPIRQAIELVPTRRASKPVKRFLCYVNADPELAAPEIEDPAEPKLERVIAYSMTLPRKARMVDQLHALEEVTRRAGLSAPAGLELASAGPDALAPAANALLRTYQDRRALLSLAELLDAPGAGSGPGLALKVLKAIGDPWLLPWIPGAIEVPAAPDDWSFGVRAAQRVLQLELDILGVALKKSSSTADGDAIFEAREAIDEALEKLDAVHADFVDPGGSIAIQAQLLRMGERLEETLGSLSGLAAGINLVTSNNLYAGTDAFVTAIHALESEEALAAIPSPATLLGSTSESPVAQREHFIRLALMVEVIRRSFVDDFDIESSQVVHVAQLTPNVRISLLRSNPFSDDDPGPCTPKEKLTGIVLAHFAAFYRASWRANDFMWGRLDGAAHTARLLVDGVRADVVQRHGRPPWEILAGALVPEGNHCRDRDHRVLAREALAKWEQERPDGEIPAVDDVAGLTTHLAHALEGDLLRGDGTLTREICARALQYNVLAEEAEHVSAQSDTDRRAGASAASLGWDTSGPLLPLVEELRGCTGDDALPCKLGRDSADESVSTLAVRTLSHAGIVALNALTGVVPIARLLQPARVPLFALQGMAQRRLLDRLAVVAGFTGAAWYLAARYLTIPKHPPPVPLGDLWSVRALALYVSLLVVVGVVALPALRAWRTAGGPPRRLGEGACAAALAATGGAVALGWQWSLNGTAVALTSSGAKYAPPDALLWIVAAAGGFHVASQLESVTRWLVLLKRPLLRLMSITSLLVAGIGLALAGFTMVGAVGPAWNAWGWKSACFFLACLGPPGVAAYLRLWEAPLTWPKKKGDEPAG